MGFPYNRDMFTGAATIRPIRITATAFTYALTIGTLTMPVLWNHTVNRRLHSTDTYGQTTQKLKSLIQIVCLLEPL